MGLVDRDTGHHTVAHMAQVVPVVAVGVGNSRLGSLVGNLSQRYMHRDPPPGAILDVVGKTAEHTLGAAHSFH